MSAYDSAPAYRPEPGAAAGRRNGLGIAALVLGIAAVALFLTMVGGVVLGILALILGIIGFRRGRRGEATNGTMSMIGAILGALGLLASVVVIGIVVFVSTSDEFHNLRDCMQHAQSSADQQQCAQNYKDSSQ